MNNTIGSNETIATYYSYPQLRNEAIAQSDLSEGKNIAG
jgi:hypothetical protein